MPDTQPDIAAAIEWAHANKNDANFANDANAARSILALTDENKRLAVKYDDAHENEIELRKQLEQARALVDSQAEDDGLWFQAQTAPEAYLQQELRKLHAAIERQRQGGE